MFNISNACVKTLSFKLINLQTDIGTRKNITLALFNQIVFNIPTSK